MCMLIKADANLSYKIDVVNSQVKQCHTLQISWASQKSIPYLTHLNQIASLRDAITFLNTQSKKCGATMIQSGMN